MLRRRVCEHCDKTLSDKAYKEHRRLYFDKGEWMRSDHQDVESRASSPICVSDPMSSVPVDLSPLPSDQGDDTNEGTAHSSDLFSDTDPPEHHFPDVEYWQESDAEVNRDLPSQCPDEPASPHINDDDDLDNEQAAFVWWVVVFTCVFQTLHSLSSRAVQWLLKFLGVAFTFLSRYSPAIGQMAQKLPTTLHQREVFLKNKLSVPLVHQMVVCSRCHSLYNYYDCLEKRGTQVVILPCPECIKSRRNLPLLKQLITNPGNNKFYPFLTPILLSHVFTAILFKRPGFLDNCE